MKNLVVVLYCLVLLTGVTVQAQDQKDVNYRIEYNEQNGMCSGVNPEPLTLRGSVFNTVMDIMEQAATTGGQSYEFSVTYFGFIGYFLDAINNVRGASPCYWAFYVQSGNIEMKPNIGITPYIPGNNFDVILRYEQSNAVFITTNYEIQYPDLICTTATPPNAISVSTPTGSTVQDVMEGAVLLGGTEYRFSLDYVTSVGSVISQVNNVEMNGSCGWSVSVTAPGQQEVLLTTTVSEYVIPGNNYTVTLRFSTVSDTLSPVTEVPAENQKTVNYRIEYNEQNGMCGGVNPEPLTLTVSVFNTVMDIMEQAAIIQGRSYEFSVTYFGTLGYFIDAINNTRSASPCFWALYVRSGNTEMQANIGITPYIPGDNFDVILRYEQSTAVFIGTNYKIQYPDLMCTTATPPNATIVFIRTGGTALNVMEGAVTSSGSTYRFSLDYVTSVGGYVTTQINNVANNGMCSWSAYVTTPSGEQSPITVPISEYIIPGNDYTLTMMFSSAAKHTNIIGMVVLGCLVFTLLHQL